MAGGEHRAPAAMIGGTAPQAAVARTRVTPVITGPVVGRAGARRPDIRQRLLVRVNSIASAVWYIKSVNSGNIHTLLSSVMLHPKSTMSNTDSYLL